MGRTLWKFQRLGVISLETPQRKLSPPDELEGVLKCRNPRCITSTEQELPQIFKLTYRAKRVYRCIYCETKVK